MNQGRRYHGDAHGKERQGRHCFMHLIKLRPLRFADRRFHLGPSKRMCNLRVSCGFDHLAAKKTISAKLFRASPISSSRERFASSEPIEMKSATMGDRAEDQAMA
jgi:hypothetical protein